MDDLNRLVSFHSKYALTLLNVGYLHLRLPMTR